MKDVCLVGVLLSILFYFTDGQDIRLKCQLPPEAPTNITKMIGLCQDEIKTAVLTAAQDFDKEITRRKRDVFSADEERIAGCLLHCVYRKMNALNKDGFPTMQGLIELYSEGTTDRDYRLATFQAVQYCQRTVLAKYLQTPQSSLKENEIVCDVAFEVFDCISTQIARYCGQTP